MLSSQHVQNMLVKLKKTKWFFKRKWSYLKISWTVLSKTKNWSLILACSSSYLSKDRRSIPRFWKMKCKKLLLLKLFTTIKLSVECMMSQRTEKQKSSATRSTTSSKAMNSCSKDLMKCLENWLPTWWKSTNQLRTFQAFALKYLTITR